MSVLDYILDGLEAALALERELGVRSVEFDRSVLAPPQPPSPIPQAPSPPPQAPVTPPQPPVTPPQAPSTPPQAPSTPPQAPSTRHQTPLSRHPSPGTYDFVFLHDRPLVSAGEEMIAKITAAMGRTSETAPVIVEPPRPEARLYVVLGDRALKKWFPGLRASPGMWITGSEGEQALVTYSPNYFLRFGSVTPTVQKIKKDMWNSLKGVLQRLELQRK